MKTSKDKFALISVSNKQNITTFAQQLIELGYQIISTGGTAQALSQANIPVTSVSDFTGFPEILNGRVKTLHPKIYAGILHRGEIDNETLQEHQIPSIDIVAVNLYPFAETIRDPKCTLEDAVEQIDIGGPCLLRASAKNFQRVHVVVDPEDYQKVVQDLKTKQCDHNFRQQLAVKVFQHTANYDQKIANFLGDTPTEMIDCNLAANQDFPTHLNLSFPKAPIDLRYGENPHQTAAAYYTPFAKQSLLNAKQYQGKPLSFNNLIDADATLGLIQGFAQPMCVIVKHTNPCGAAVSDSLINAYQLAYACDPVSAFGGIIGMNRPIDEATAKAILENQFVEVLLAPSYTQEALQQFAQKPNIRIIEIPTSQPTTDAFQFTTIQGGLLVQEQDLSDSEEWQIVSIREPSKQENIDLKFAWQLAKAVKSNAIVYVKDGQSVGIGAGQMSRVFSAEIGLMKAQQAKLATQGAVMASDAFFPFADSIENAAAAGITAIIQPGGSMRDEEVIEAANQFDIAMIMTHKRHFKH